MAIEIVNAFDHPAGGFMSASYKKVAGSVFDNLTDCVISFRAPDAAPAGLREFFHTEPSQAGLNADWGYFNDFQPGTSATTQGTVRLASGEPIQGSNQTDTYTYAGSWYVPTAGIYSFRMNMLGTGELVIDNRIIVQQTENATVAAANDVPLAAGWHNLFIVFRVNFRWDGGLQKNISEIGPAGETAGLLYSASNADLVANPAAGSPFATEEGEGGHRLSTAYNGVFVPSLWAVGGTVTLDCANALGDLRIAGQWGYGSPECAFVIANLPAGRTIEIGRPTAAAAYGYQNLENFAWIDWSKTQLPEGVNIRFEGAVAFDTLLPEGHSWSWGRRVTLATTLPDFFGTVETGATTFAWPEGLLQLYLGRPHVLGDTAKIVVPAGRVLALGGGDFNFTKGVLPYTFGYRDDVFKNPIELEKSAAMNMTPRWDGGGICGGTVMGPEGDLRITGWGRRMIVDNAIDVGVVVAQQRGNRILLRPVAGAVASRIGKVEISGDDVGTEYCGATLFYCPQEVGAPPLSIELVKTSGASYTPGQEKHVRNGATLSTCSNNTITISSLIADVWSGSRGIQLRTVIPGGTNDDVPEAGGGNFAIGSIDAAMPVFVSTNVNLTVTNVAQAVDFRYDVNAAGAANDGVLDIEGTCAAESTLTAPDIAVLPARVKNFTGSVTLTETTEGKTYPVTIDFTKPAPVIGGCDGSGTLVKAPATGVIAVAFAGDEPVAGEYGLARFTVGGNLLAG